MGLIRHLRVVRMLLAAGLLTAGFAFSEADAFSVSPGVMEICLPAGESYMGNYIISNSEDKNIRIRVSAEDWSSDLDGRKIEKGDKDFLGWLRFMPQEVELEPGESREVRYVINLPAGAKGEYSAMIYFGDAADPSKKGVSIASRIGNALYVIVKGTEVVSGRISDIKILGADPLKINVIIENMGNIHVRPAGTIKVTNAGHTLLDMPFNDAGFPIFPQQIYTYEARSKEKLSAGKYRLDFNMKFGKAEFKKEIDFAVNEEGKILILR